MADPNEKFIVKTMTRKHIAQELNRFIDLLQLDCESFTDDDDRLTAYLCNKYVHKVPLDFEDASAYEYHEQLAASIIEAADK